MVISVLAAATAIVPQLIDLPLQVPEPADTDTATFPAAVGMRFAGVHVRPLVTAVPLHCTVGVGVIAVPTVPVVAVILQASVYELLLTAALELLTALELLALLELLTAALELLALLELLTAALELLTAALELLGLLLELLTAALLLLLCCVTLELLAALLELLTTAALTVKVPQSAVNPWQAFALSSTSTSMEYSPSAGLRSLSLGSVDQVKSLSGSKLIAVFGLLFATHFTLVTLDISTRAPAVPVLVTSQVRVYGDSPLEELPWFAPEELLPCTFELEEPLVFPLLEPPFALEELASLDELDGNAVTEDIKSGFFIFPFRKSLELSISLLISKSPITSSGVPLPQAIIIATAASAAKTSDIKLMNLFFFIIIII